jgi:uncharacterized protein YjbI with pentapeptide repeats
MRFLMSPLVGFAKLARLTSGGDISVLSRLATVVVVKSESPEELHRRWWGEWWRKDYSWDGLAALTVTGWYKDPEGRFTRSRGNASNPRLTLQDVWRHEEARLITDAQKRKWTSVHLPLTWQDGTPAKSIWTLRQLRQLDQAVADAAAQFPDDPPTKAARRIAVIPPSMIMARAHGFPLDGAVLPVTPPIVQRMKHLRADRAAFVSLDLAGLESTYLRFCLFDEGLALRKIQRGRDCRIWAGLITGNLALDTIKLDRLRFGDCVVTGKASLKTVEARDRLNFTKTHFFRGLAFEAVKAPSIGLEKARIEADLTVSAEAEIIDLSGLKVEGDLAFNEVTVETVDAIGLEVAGKADFTDLVVTEAADFSESSWGRKADFIHAKLNQPTFNNADFQGRSWFDAATFTGEVSFSEAHFRNAVSFKDVKWKGEPKDHVGAFRQTRFESFVDFRSAAFEAFSAFNGANFKGEIRFLRGAFTDDRLVHRLLRNAKGDDAKVELEYGFRALKQAAENVRDRHLEQVFFRYELLARRSQEATPTPERLASKVYGVVSNYGSSFIRPLLFAALLWALFIPTYLALGAMTGAAAYNDLTLAGGPLHPGWLTAIDLSSRSMFNLFGVWTVRPPTEDLAALSWSPDTALLHASALVGVIVRLASSLQSLFAGVLLFLIALAARRRFQIS